MGLKKILGLVALCFALNLNASMISAFFSSSTNENIDDSSKLRGVVISQDIDGDGIIDSKDNCLKTVSCSDDACAKPAKVIEVVDLDKDGVMDNVDKCLETPLGFEVDLEGCSKFVNLRVLFETNKYEVRDEFSGEIGKLIAFLQKHEEYKVVIEGHTDSVASNVYNMQLSQKRANSIRDYILKNSEIDSTRVSVDWFGEEKPLNNNLNDKEKLQNRRVVAILTK